MNLKKRIIAATAVLLLLTAVSPAPCQEAGRLFERALFLEESSGELMQAISLYDRIVKEFNNDQETAAKAQLHIGICYEKLGKSEAVKAYESVIHQFPNATGVVSEARTRLAELKKEKSPGLVTTRLSRPDVARLEGPSLSPDGTTLAGVIVESGQNLAVIDLETGKMELLTDYNWEQNSRWVWIPIWSPDGRKLVYQDVLMGRNNAYELHIRDLSGGSRILIRNPEGGLAACDWLQDGKTILVIRGDKRHGTAMGLVSAETGNFRELCPLQKTFSTVGDVPSQRIAASADASPDGRWIAFADSPDEGAGDIYLLSSDGGQRTALIDHPADDSEPRWSPDGRYIIYLSNRHGKKALWGIAVRDGKADGLPFMIKEGMEDTHLSSWTTAGLLTTSFLVIVEINVIGIDPEQQVVTSPPRIMDFPPRAWYVSPRWSPDGKYLSAIGYRNVEGGGMQAFLSIISIIPAQGGEVREYTIDYPIVPAGGTGHWLPQGAVPGYIIYDKDKNLCLGTLDLVTGTWNSRMIPTAEGFNGFEALAWSEGGKGFYYLPVEENGDARRLVWQNLENGDQRTVFQTGPGEGLLKHIRISPDMKQLALNSSEGEILIIDAETGEARKIGSEGIPPLYSPTWAPDGTTLVAKDNPGLQSSAATELYSVTVTDGSYKSLNISSFLPRKGRITTAPDWSPDGRSIAFELRFWNLETNLIRNIISR